MAAKPYVIEMERGGSGEVWYLARCPVGGFVDSWSRDGRDAHPLLASSPEAAIEMARETRCGSEFDRFRAVPATVPAGRPG